MIDEIRLELRTDEMAGESKRSVKRYTKFSILRKVKT